MSRIDHQMRSTPKVIAAALLGLLASTPLARAQITTSTPPESASRWPMELDTPDGQVTVYQPQLIKFDGDKISARAAVSVQKPGQQEPVFGAIWMESRVSTDRVARTVQILDVKVTRVRFPEGTSVSEQNMTTALSTTLPDHPLSLDQLLAMVEEVQQEKESVQQISNAPPKIIFTNHPAVLVQYDGAPHLGPVNNSNLLRAENTPFFVVEDPSSQTYFLKGAGRWFTARNPLGPFQLSGAVPPAVSGLADSSGYQDPEQPLTDQQARQMEIITATEPTEVIWTDGPLQMGTIPDTNLLYVMNTDSNVFRLINTQAWYVLLSGRWYTAPNQNGPWTYIAPDKLPDDFKRIPPASAKAEVLAHVAGTPEAQDAVADTFVPQTAAINRNDFEQPAVTYDGDPDFAPIQDTQMQYAVNTGASVILVNGRYYCCSNAVWYDSANPSGPWGLCTAVPAPIYTIPPTCPLYPVRYCYVYGVTPTLVYVGYTPGYVGCYRYNHTVIYGTGWRYKPWIGRRFYPRPLTYGFSAHYDPYTGFWGFRVGIHDNDGQVWIGAGRTRLVHRPGWFGHGGYRPPVVRRDIYLHRNVFERPSARPAQWNLYEQRKDVRAERIGNRQANRPQPGRGLTGPNRVPTPPRNQSRPPTASRRDDIYADPSGNVFRRTNNGWEQRQQNKWVRTPEPVQKQQRNEPPRAVQPVPPPGRVESGRTQAPNPSPGRNEQRQREPARVDEGSLNRDFRARQFGQDRAEMFQRNQRSEERSAPQPRQQQQRDSQDQGNQGNRGGGRR